VSIIVLFMIVILALAATVAGLVVMGIEGHYHDRAPKLAHQLTRAARHLNGDGKPPKHLVQRLNSTLSR